MGNQGRWVIEEERHGLEGGQWESEQKRYYWQFEDKYCASSIKIWCKAVNLVARVNQ